MKQHRSRLPVLLAPLLALAIANASQAGFVDPLTLNKGDTIQLNRSGASGGGDGGGEFQMYHSGVKFEFLTYCLEVKEYTELNKDFVFGGLSDTSFFGSGDLNGGGVALTHETRFLYNAYVTGKLVAETAFVSGTNSWANAFQQVIWKLQNQPDWGNKLFSLGSKQEQLYVYANTNAAPEEDYDVYAMNLFKTSVSSGALASFDPDDSNTWADVYSHRAQDMLIYAPSPPPPPQPVPEPATVTV